MSEPPSVEPSLPEQSVPRLSLRNKLLVFAFALVVLPGALLAALATHNASAALEAQAGRALVREASHTADRLSSLLFAERDSLRSFARQDLMRDVRVGDVDKRASMALATLRARGPHHYYVVDPQPRVVAASEAGAIGALPPWASPEWFAPRSERVLGPYGAPRFASERLVITSAIPDPDDPTRTLGTLLGVYDWRALTAATREVERDLAQQGFSASVLVCAEDGAVLGGAWSRGAARDVIERGARIAATAGGGAPTWSAQAATALIAARAPLAPGLPRWRVVVLEPRASALAPVRDLQRRMALTLGIALAVALTLAVVAAGRVVRPLSELTEAVRKLARREGGAPLSVPVRSDDEIGALAGAFNRMSADLERAQRELVEAGKFAFVGELAAGVAHEIRTSLGVLKSSVQLLDRSLPAGASAEAHELAQMVREEVGRLGGVVDDLLTLRPERALRLEAGPLSALLAHAVEFASAPARAKGIRIVAPSAPADEPLVAHEPELIHQVAVNLVVNAVQALGNGGTIEVAVLPAQQGFGGFEVRDDGPGIPEELRERVFQPFVTGRSGGVGLGLTFVKRVVQEHRGRIAIASEPGRGVRVRVELPLAEPTA